jgi:putative transcriptional regulator
VNLSHHFLLSMPQMLDPSFEHTLIYICDHDERGALGLIVNRTLNMSLGEVLEQMDIEVPNPQVRHRTVYEGGPVDPTHGLVLHNEEEGQNWSGTHRFGHGLCISSSRDILEDIATGKGPSHYLVTLGHAGWSPGQLEEELSANAWLTCSADPEIMFATAVELRLQKAAALLGIDLNNISTDTGHA